MTDASFESLGWHDERSGVEVDLAPFRAANVVEPLAAQHQQADDTARRIADCASGLPDILQLAIIERALAPQVAARQPERLVLDPGARRYIDTESVGGAPREEAPDRVQRVPRREFPAAPLDRVQARNNVPALDLCDR